MITQNFENFLSMILASSSSSYGRLPVRLVNGATRFLTHSFSSSNSAYFPCNRTGTFTLSATSAGLSVGTGAGPASEKDYNLANTITSGINGTVTTQQTGCDAPGAPYIEYSLTITNTDTHPVTITEIGYKQTVYVTEFPDGTSASSGVCLLDRTILDTPITIQGGDAGVIKYKLQTTRAIETKAGVNLVNFTYGSDEDVAAMIDAARRGDIDLQTDGGWAVGDYRTIHVDAFTSGGVSHAAQDIGIIITEFSDYNSCGSLFQFDFAESCATAQRMNGAPTNVGGYGGSEMYTDTLPALVNALPSWLKSRLLPFDVLASAGGGSSTIETVSGNKLALRSEIEIFGTTSYSVVGEGSQIAWYELALRTKRQGRTGSANIWWERSPYSGNSSSFCLVRSNGAADGGVASTARGLAPFGCI